MSTCCAPVVGVARAAHRAVTRSMPSVARRCRPRCRRAAPRPHRQATDGPPGRLRNSAADRPGLLDQEQVDPKDTRRIVEAGCKDEGRAARRADRAEIGGARAVRKLRRTGDRQGGGDADHGFGDLHLVDRDLTDIDADRKFGQREGRGFGRGKVGPSGGRGGRSSTRRSAVSQFTSSEPDKSASRRQLSRAFSRISHSPSRPRRSDGQVRPPRTARRESRRCAPAGSSPSDSCDSRNRIRRPRSSSCAATGSGDMTAQNAARRTAHQNACPMPI
jgi:hypothetical protein